MKKSYVAPITEIIDLDSLSFLSASGEVEIIGGLGDAAAYDPFATPYGRRF